MTEMHKQSKRFNWMLKYIVSKHTHKVLGKSSFIFECYIQLLTFIHIKGFLYWCEPASFTLAHSLFQYFILMCCSCGCISVRTSLLWSLTKCAACSLSPLVDPVCLLLWDTNTTSRTMGVDQSVFDTAINVARKNNYWTEWPKEKEVQRGKKLLLLEHWWFVESKQKLHKTLK